MLEQKVSVLKERLNSFMQVIDMINPEEVDVADVDRLLEMLAELEEQLQTTKEK